MKWYSVKAFFSIMSGYVRLEARWGDSWVAPGEDDPWYWCARFNNGRHIPLPILESPNGLQGLAIRIASLLLRLRRNRVGIEQALEDAAVLQGFCPQCGQKIELIEEETMHVSLTCTGCLPPDQAGPPDLIRTYKCPRGHYSYTTQCGRCGQVSAGLLTWHGYPCQYCRG